MLGDRSSLLAVVPPHLGGRRSLVEIAEAFLRVLSALLDVPSLESS
jgi:hypothetical protein